MRHLLSNLAFYYILQSVTTTRRITTTTTTTTFQLLDRDARGEKTLCKCPKMEQRIKMEARQRETKYGTAHEIPTAQCENMLKFCYFVDPCLKVSPPSRPWGIKMHFWSTKTKCSNVRGGICALFLYLVHKKVMQV